MKKIIIGKVVIGLLPKLYWVVKMAFFVLFFEKFFDLIYTYPLHIFSNQSRFCKKFIYILTCLPFLCSASAPFVLFTIPKSGSWLAKTFLEKLTGKEGQFLYFPPDDFNERYLKHFEEGVFYFYHYRDWNNYPSQSEVFDSVRILLNIRDPRDVCVASVLFFCRELDFLLGKEATFDERLAYVITSDLIHDGLHDFFGPFAFSKKGVEVMDRYHPKVIRFEDLVGPKGGGDLERQRLVIQEIAETLGLSLTDEEALSIGDSIYGNTLTFRDGKIGSWKTHFNQDHKELFKNSRFEEVLLRFGYERDHNW